MSHTGPRAKIIKSGKNRLYFLHKNNFYFLEVIIMKNEISVLSILNRINMKDLNLPEGPYYIDNYYVPRVSEILAKMIHEDYLMVWANGMGRRGLDHTAVAKESADYGTEVHHRAEILLGSNEEEKNKIINLNDMNSYIALKKWISDSVSKIRTKRR